VEHSDAERGLVTGAPVGCACGDGVLDWSRIVGIVKDKCRRDIVFSVESRRPERRLALQKLYRLRAFTPRAYRSGRSRRAGVLSRHGGGNLY
jgi:hypothetical protein